MKNSKKYSRAIVLLVVFLFLTRVYAYASTVKYRITYQKPIGNVMGTYNLKELIVEHYEITPYGFVLYKVKKSDGKSILLRSPYMIIEECGRCRG